MDRFCSNLTHAFVVLQNIYSKFELGHLCFMSFMGIYVNILEHPNMGTWSKYEPILFTFSTQIECFREGLKTEFERDCVYIVSFMLI